MFKLRNCSIKFIVKEEEKVVVSLVEMAIVIPQTNKTVSVFTCQGLAKCNPDDTFDVVAGKRLARAKAEKKAYFKFAHFLFDMQKKLTFTQAQLMDVIKKNNNCIDHQIAYIKENF